MLKWLALFVLTLHAACVRPHVARPAVRREPPALSWHGLEPDALARARRERKLILLSVQADFCHWCHVMNATTYRDPELARLLREHFVLLRIDQAERPDLAARYADYGWPATALLTPDLQPIVTLRGHQPTSSFLPLLRSVVAELASRGTVAARMPDAPETEGSAELSRARNDALLQLDALYDEREGGWGGPQKYPFSAPIQHALFRAYFAAEPERLARALTTLHGHAALIDPVAGGMFQYSTGGVWSAPHFEKIAEVQAAALLDFGEAYRASRDPYWNEQGMRIARYVLGTLRRDQGCFSANQHADVGAPGEAGFMAGKDYYALPGELRARTSAPGLNTRVYANLNGQLIHGLLAMYRANAEPLLLQAAVACMDQLSATHGRGAAFAHEARDVGPFYLSDQVAMIEALLAQADAEHSEPPRRQAYQTMDFVLRELQDEQHGGFYATTARAGEPSLFAEQLKPTADNARFVQLLLRRARREHDNELLELAERALGSQTQLSRLQAQGRKVGDSLLALEQARSDFVMFSLVGPRDDPRSTALYEAAYRLYAPGAILRSDEPGQGLYPYLGRPCIYLCSQSACSAPVFDPARLQQALAGFAPALPPGARGEGAGR